ncbi:MAG: acyl-CoA dehydrogenase family protein [Candidatus Kapabacteria bacterium]|nr:acyl-CoA dehydrogenase family protein [Candidatus Kapabacteria bacterium]
MAVGAQRERMKMLLAREEQEWLRERSSEWAELETVPEDIVEWLVRRRMFKLFVPAAFGGGEQSLTEAVRLYEALAEADGSVAWLVQIGAGGGFFVPSFAPEIAQQFFSGEGAVIAGSGAVAGTARRVAGGYRVSGRWRYASGAQYATLFTANARVQETGAVRAFAWLPEQVRLERDWRALGMRATSSWSFTVDDVFVPEERSFVVGQKLWKPGLLVYELPFEFFATASIGAVALGLAQAFFQELETMERPAAVRADLPRWRGLLEYARRMFHETVNWAEKTTAVAGEKQSEQEGLEEWMLRGAFQIARQCVLEALPAVGMVVILEGNTIGRIARDFLTICQHRVLRRPEWAWEGGRS